MKLKITRQNYLLYLVIFALILLVFFYLISDKNAIVRQLHKEFYGDLQPAVAPLREGLESDGLTWTAYEGYNGYKIVQDTPGLTIRSSGGGAYNFSSIETATSNNVRTWDTNFTLVFTGFFCPNKKGVWQFRAIYDDTYFMWLKDPAAKGWTTDNALHAGGGWTATPTYSYKTDYLLDTECYPIRINLSQGWGPCSLKIEWRAPESDVWTSNGAGLFKSASSAAGGTPESGIQWRIYDGYYWDDLNYINKAKLAANGSTINTLNISSITNGKLKENAIINDNGVSPYPINDAYTWSGGYNNYAFTMELFGYFYTNTTNTDPNKKWGFFLASDDASYFWIGDKANSGYTTSNADINNGGGHGILTRSVELSLQPNKYYPIRIMYGEGGGAFNLRFGWRPPGGNWTCDGNGYLYIKDFSEIPNDHLHSNSRGPKS